MPRWTRTAWTTLVALHCALPPPTEGAIRVLAFPKSSHVPIIHPADEDVRRPGTPDMAVCLWAMSYTCLQRKTVVYLDALNRMDRISLLGDFVTAVRTQPVDARTPTIDERLLESRGFNNVLSLSVLVDSVVRSIVKEHALRISFPRIVGLGGAFAPALPQDESATEASNTDTDDE